MSAPQTTARPTPGAVRVEALDAVPGFEIGRAIAPETAHHGRLGTRDGGMNILLRRACSRRPRLSGNLPGAAPRPDFDPAPFDGKPSRLRCTIRRHAIANAPFGDLAPRPVFREWPAARRADSRCARFGAPHAMIHSLPAAGTTRRASVFSPDAAAASPRSGFRRNRDKRFSTCRWTRPGSLPCRSMNTSTCM
ncbi:hypothetical protein [Burkholderia sp. 3C]